MNQLWYKKNLRMLPKRLKWKYQPCILCYQNVWNEHSIPLTFCYISTFQLRMTGYQNVWVYLIFMIHGYQNVWFMLPKRLDYVTKTFDLCYQNVWFMLPKRLKWSCNLLILSIVLRSIILIILSNFIIFIIFQGKKDCFLMIYRFFYS